MTRIRVVLQRWSMASRSVRSTTLRTTEICSVSILAVSSISLVACCRRPTVPCCATGFRASMRCDPPASVCRRTPGSRAPGAPVRSIHSGSLDQPNPGPRQMRQETGRRGGEVLRPLALHADYNRSTSSSAMECPARRSAGAPGGMTPRIRALCRSHEGSKPSPRREGST
jgi:hypothetical protein